MRKTWTITVDIRDNDITTFEDDAEEMAYWADTIETAIEGVQYQYRKNQDQPNNWPNYESFDFTTIDVVRSDSGDYTEVD